MNTNMSDLSEPMLNYSFGLPVYPLKKRAKSKLHKLYSSGQLKGVALKPYCLYLDHHINFDNVHFVIHEFLLRPKYRRYLFNYYEGFFATGAPLPLTPPAFENLDDVMTDGQYKDKLLEILPFIPNNSWQFFFHMYRVPKTALRSSMVNKLRNF